MTVYCKDRKPQLRPTQYSWLVSDKFDLNLLRVFDVLMETRSVTDAAIHLRLSAPATSRALARLRVAMNDQILVRAGRDFVPTPFALHCAPQVKQILRAATQLRESAAESDPASWQRTFSIRINDALAPVIGPRLTSRLAEEAPGVQIRFIAQDSKDPEPLRDGSLDLDLGVLDPPPPDVHSQALFSDHFVAAVAADSPLGRAPVLSIEDVCSYPHISASRRGLAHGPIDDELRRRGLSRRVATVVPTYPVGAILALEQDVICLIPRVLAQDLINRGIPLRRHEIPLPLPSVRVDLRWHRRLNDDPPLQWLRRHIEEAVQPLITELST